MEYVLHLAVLIMIYVALGSSYDIIAGRAGLVSLAHGAFFGVGAYATALSVTLLGTGFLTTLGIAMGSAAAASLLVSLPSGRLRGDYYVVATFGLQMVAFAVLNNSVTTGGPRGISGIAPPTLLGWTVDSTQDFAVLASLTTICVLAIGWLVTSSPFGRVLNAIREDELLARSLGKSILQVRISASAVSAGLAGAAGAVYAYYMTYIDPTSFTVEQSILILSMVVVGGAGSTWGPVLGAAVLVLLPECLRFLGLPPSVAAHTRQIIYGGLLTAMMFLRPQGLIGRYGWTSPPHSKAS